MKKNILIYIITIFFIYFTFINQTLIVNAVINSSLLFLTKVLSFFLPMYIISKILINYNFPVYISKLFNNNIYVYILLISFISGSPNNAILIKDLLNKNIITINEANKYIKCSFFQNPLFLYTIISNIFNNKIAIIIIISQILSNIILYLIKPIKSKYTNIIKSISLSDLLVKTINESINILLYIYLSIVLFNIVIVLIPNSLSNFIGILEITSGLNYLIISNNTIIIKLLLTIIYISFGGLAIHLQIKSVLKDTNILYSNFLLSRFYQMIIMILFIIIHYILFKP